MMGQVLLVLRFAAVTSATLPTLAVPLDTGHPHALQRAEVCWYHNHTVRVEVQNLK